MEEYALASAEAAYENPGGQAQMGFMVLGKEIQGSENVSPQMDWKRSFSPYRTGTDNTRWKTETIHIIMAEEAIRNATKRFNSPVEYLGCTNSPRYHVDRLHTHRNFPNKRYPDVAEQAKESIQ